MVIITVGSYRGVWSMIFLGSLMRGITDQMVRNSIATLTGHIQVHHKGYRSDPVIENSVLVDMVFLKNRSLDQVNR